MARLNKKQQEQLAQRQAKRRQRRAEPKSEKLARAIAKLCGGRRKRLEIQVFEGLEFSIASGHLVCVHRHHWRLGGSSVQPKDNLQHGNKFIGNPGDEQMGQRFAQWLRDHVSPQTAELPDDWMEETK
jgi:hypothetical protein